MVNFFPFRFCLTISEFSYAKPVKLPPWDESRLRLILTPEDLSGMSKLPVSEFRFCNVPVNPSSLPSTYGKITVSP